MCMQIGEVVELILSGNLGSYFYLNSLMAMILIAMLLGPSGPIYKYVKVFMILVICFEIYVSYSLADHFLCLEKPQEIFEAVTIVAMLLLSGGFVLFLFWRLVRRIYNHLKFAKNGRNNQ